MLDNITLGQYYPVKSFVHSLDPRAKILLTVALIVAVFLAEDIIAFIPIVAYLFLSAKMSNIPPKMLTKGLKSLRFLLIFTFILNLLFTPGDTVFLNLGFTKLSVEGTLTAVKFSLRLIFLVLGTSLLTLTTPPVVLTDGLERLLSPLSVIHFPAHEMAMMMTIALRFIPTLLEEATKIQKAQTARGADFESGNLIARAKAMVPLLVPLFVSAFRRAGELAMAMEARCYHGGEGRTRLRILKLTKNDLCAALSMLALILAVIFSGKII